MFLAISDISSDYQVKSNAGFARHSCVSMKSRHGYLISPWCRINVSVNRANIVSYNGLSRIRRQAMIWTKAGLLAIGPLGTNVSDISNKIKLYIHEKAYEIIVAAILSRGDGLTRNNILIHDSIT